MAAGNGLQDLGFDESISTLVPVDAKKTWYQTIAKSQLP